MAQLVKGPVLLQLRHRSQLQFGFNPWPRNFHNPEVQQKIKQMIINWKIKIGKTIRADRRQMASWSQVGLSCLPVCSQILWGLPWAPEIKCRCPFLGTHMQKTCGPKIMPLVWMKRHNQNSRLKNLLRRVVTPSCLYDIIQFDHVQPRSPDTWWNIQEGLLWRQVDL